MKTIEKLIKDLRYKASAETHSRGLDNVLKALETNKNPKPAQHEPNIWRVIMKARMLKISSAAAVLLCVLGLLVFFGNGHTLYAQVIKAFEKTRTVHIVMKEYRDGDLYRDDEIWYDRQIGVREEKRYENQTDIRIDDNQYEWRYTVGNVFAAKVSSYRNPDEWIDDLYDWLRFDPQRVPSGDKVIDDVPCEKYILLIPDSDEKVSVWVDEQHRVLEFEYEEQRSGRLIKGMATMKYDVDVDQNLFVPDFSADVEIVGPRELIEEQFPLETAIFKRESLGFVFAVHELKSGNGFKYLICSSRLTEQMRDEISTGHLWNYYGGFTLMSKMEETGMIPGSSYMPHHLARLKHDDIQVMWYVLVPYGSEAKQSAGINLDVYINTANQLNEKLNAEGLPTQEKFELDIKPGQIDEQLLSTAEITSQIFSFGKEMAPIVHSFKLIKIATNIDETKKHTWKRPGTELSEEEYIKSWEDGIEYYLNQN